MNEYYFLLFECCRLVKGNSYSIIMDLQRREYLQIPNLLYEVLSSDLRNLTIKELKEKFNHRYDEGIEKYINFLTEEEYGYLTQEPNNFPEMEVDFKIPNKIMSSVICLDRNSDFSLNNLMQELQELGCQTIQIRICDSSNFDDVLSLMDKYNDSSFELIELFLPFDKDIDLEKLKHVLLTNLRVKIVIHSANRDEKLLFSNRSIHFTKQMVNFETEEIYDLRFLHCDTRFFCEAKNYNVGLNKKVCVDSSGNIKNYINHSYSYGNVKEKRLSDVITTKKFQFQWSIKNDIIEKCKECQFRYMCLSNSEIQKRDDKYYKVHYCDFDL
ncbi:grasp-with-spasm system SPASM domain peptide maturase [Aquimarina spongiae]|uniref:SPASM domain peptide maturase, grasp-with-spasm system n=1 Tax=Aquimarina spongiae TaxID=570521 RepID=A0A1M6DDS6_9FLAO|nr:grasp-with-spasm system SPASM domain peptide maturase [Aquimarina spongiae]SHI71201.1 SPASM domain peptide maturase, grasp-with-spasm system [Aquimarina spongiae]